jgi:hypothetical protein
MGPPGVVECDPAVDDMSGVESVRDLCEVDRLLLQGSPETLDEDVVEEAAPPVLSEGGVRPMRTSLSLPRYA